jgi:hypothetical protein
MSLALLDAAHERSTDPGASRDSSWLEAFIMLLLRHSIPSACETLLPITMECFHVLVLEEASKRPNTCTDFNKYVRVRVQRLSYLG